jgi:hypothetical protein
MVCIDMFHHREETHGYLPYKYTLTHEHQSMMKHHTDSMQTGYFDHCSFQLDMKDSQTEQSFHHRADTYQLDKDFQNSSPLGNTFQADIDAHHPDCHPLVYWSWSLRNKRILQDILDSSDDLEQHHTSHVGKSHMLSQL